MDKEKAIEIFNKWMDCKDAYQADPSCDGNCFSCEYYASAEEEKEAMLLAISALEKQEQTKEVIPHRNYQYLLDYWCECGWHLGKKGDVKFCADCGRRIKWD